MNEGAAHSVRSLSPSGRGSRPNQLRVQTMAAQSKKIGDITVTTLSDGVLTAPLDVVLGMDKAETERLAGRKDNVPISVNAFLLERAGRWALVDTGSSNTMGPTLGKLP